jgi:hypothetical protein
MYSIDNESFLYAAPSDVNITTLSHHYKQIEQSLENGGDWSAYNFLFFFGITMHLVFFFS